MIFRNRVSLFKMDILLFVLRILMAIVLYAFLGVVLWVLLREQRDTSKHTASVALLRLDAAGAPVMSAGGRFTLNTQAPTWIGRDPNCAIRINSDRASAQHARVNWRAEAQAWWIEDNSSRNGTLVNGERVMSAQLAPGDVIEIGGTQFRFTGGD